MKRKSVIMIAVTAMLFLASCSSDLGFFKETENTSSITILPEETGGEETEEIVGETSEEKEVKAERMPVFDNSDIIDEDYFRDNPEVIPQDIVYTNRGDTLYREDLQDDILLNDANELFEQGYIITSAEQLAEQGASIGIDEDHYLYRGFAAIYITEDNKEATDLIYEYILPKEAFDIILEPYKEYPFVEEQQGTKYLYTINDVLYITYDTATELMFYSTVPVG